MDILPDWLSEHLKHPLTYTVQKGKIKEEKVLEGLEKWTSIAALVVLTPVLVGIPIFYGMTGYFKSRKVKEFTEKLEADQTVGKANNVSQKQFPSPRAEQFAKPLPPVPPLNRPSTPPISSLPEVKSSPPVIPPKPEVQPSLQKSISLPEIKPPPSIPPKPPVVKEKLASHFPFESPEELAVFVKAAPEQAERVLEIMKELQQARFEIERSVSLDALMSQLVYLTTNEPASLAGKKAQEIVDRIEGKQKQKERGRSEILRDLENPETNLRDALHAIRDLDVNIQNIPFNKILKTKFRIIGTPGDGNCAAYALVKAAESGRYPELAELFEPRKGNREEEALVSQGRTHEIVRRRAVEHMRKNAADFAPFCHDVKAGPGESHVDDFEDYLAIMEIPDTYLGPQEFLAIAQLVGYRIDIYNPHTVFVNQNGKLNLLEENSLGKSDRVVHLSHTGGAHYELLLPIPGVEPLPPPSKP